MLQVWATLEQLLGSATSPEIVNQRNMLYVEESNFDFIGVRHQAALLTFCCKSYRVMELGYLREIFSTFILGNTELFWARSTFPHPSSGLQDKRSKPA